MSLYAASPQYMKIYTTIMSKSFIKYHIVLKITIPKKFITTFKGKSVL